MADTNLTATRRAWHGVAELVLAGPEYRRSGTIRLGVRPGGFGSIREPELRVEGAELLSRGARVPLKGTTIADVGAAAGVDVGAPEGLYHGGSGAAPGDRVDVDSAAAAYLAGCLAIGDAALRRLAPDEMPVLWPEHFDVGIVVDEVNFGVSLGDDWLDEPYAYVSPWRKRSGEFWAAPFGAATPLRAHDNVDALTAYFTEGAARARNDPPADA